MTAPEPEVTAELPEVLFHEPGATWWWALAGPLSGVAILLIQMSAGGGFEPVVPVIFLVLVTGFLSVQIKAARIHTSVELTATSLRQGAETIRIAEIVKIFPPASGTETPRWQSYRALGELTGVPRGRTGIGVKLAGDRSAQAWAKKHARLREALTALVDGADT